MSTSPIPTSGQNTGNLRPAWRAGVSGNPGGRPKTSHFRKTTIKQLKTEIALGVNQLECVVDSQIQKAIAGDTAAFNSLATIVDGKPDSSSSSTSIQIAISVDAIGQ